MYVATEGIDNKHARHALAKEALAYPAHIVAGATKLGPWETLTSRYAIAQTAAEHEEMRGLLHYWSRAFPRTQLLGDPRIKSTFAERFLGVPSLIVRADYFLHKNGIKLCEIEERPAGIALTGSINKTFRRRTEKLLESFEKATGKKLAIVISKKRRENSDDPYWAGSMFHRRIPIFYDMPSAEDRASHVFLVRSMRDEEEYFDLHHESISTIAQEGDKAYGVAMNLWKRIGDIDELPWSSGVVLKPRAGSRFEEVLIARDGGKLPGMHTVTRAKLAIEQNKVAYWQPFYEPEIPKFLNPRGANIRNFMLRRAFWGLDAVTGNWTSLGGVWMANPTVRIHGTRASLCGPLTAIN